MRPIARPGAALAGGILVVACTAVAPAGLGGGHVPTASWAVWGLVLIGSFVVLCRAMASVVDALRRLSWLLPAVLLLTLPLAVFAAGRRAPLVVLALMLRSFTAATAGFATMAALGPSGFVAGLRSLHAPSRLIEVVDAMLSSLAAIGRQVSGMLRARAARRPSRAPWSALTVAPVETLRGFGRLVGAGLLRAIERAESLERARRARGGGDA